MISKKYVGLFAIICTIGIGIPGVIDVDASIFDNTFEYRKCLFEGQFWDMFCPSNPDNYKGAGICLVYDKNCLFVQQDSSIFRN